MKSLFIYTLLLIISVGFISCDSSVTPPEIFEDTPSITQFQITPSSVQFTPADGITDTTVTVQIEGETVNTNNHQVTLSILERDSGEPLLSEELEISDQAFEYQLPFETRTTFFQDFIVYARLSDGQPSSNYGQGRIKITGFSTQPPEIESVNNPESVQRPDDGERPVGFQADVTDVEGLDTIEGVYLRLISRSTGELSDSPFRLYDNGSNGDQTADDGTFTRVFRFNSGNELDEYDVEYYAIDRGGLVSDTVKTTFSIVE